MSIFDKRLAFKPFEYPEVVAYKEAIQHSYWLVSEWSFTSDVHDFNTKLTSTEKSAIKNALLAISQIEVSVKRFWSRLGDRLPKPEIEFVGSTFGESECYDGDTEILTSRGWVKFPLLREGEEVAQYYLDTGTIDFVVPTGNVVRHYSGVMHHYVSSGTDLMVTPNHEILVKHPQKDTFQKRKSMDGTWGGNYRYPTAGLATGALVFSDVDRLAIAIQADGSLYGSTPTGKGRRDVNFNLKKTRKIQRLFGILEKLGIKYSHSKRKNGFSCINFTLPSELPVDGIKNFGYVDVSKVSESFGREFLSELKEWDCGSGQGNGFTYYNANADAVDKVQAIAVLSGFTSNKGVNRTAEESLSKPLPGGVKKKSAKTVYALHLTPFSQKIYPKRKEVEYDGKVYCVTVPSGALVTRRNKRVAVCGNCRHADAYSHLLHVLSLNDDFEQLLTNPVIQGRVDYLQKYLRGAAENSNESYTLTLTLFSIFIENVSLFSQFLIIKAFNKERKVLKDVENVVQATAKEEQIHALFGVKLLEIIRNENPDWFNEDFYSKLERACKKAYLAEEGIIDWIFEEGELDFLPKVVVKEFVKDRFNKSLQLVGSAPIFDVDKARLEKVKWFDEEAASEVNVDFFNKKPVTYSKKLKAITEEDLF